MIRRASTLVIVTGLAALILSMSLAYLMRVRGDSRASADVLNDAQARLMLIAGMTYVCECSRIGWGRETFGWNDVRDHSAGPKDIDGKLPTGASEWEGTTEWPAPGSVARGAMHVMTRPPWAVKPVVAANPIVVVDADQTPGTGEYRDGSGDAVVSSGGASFPSARMLADFSQPDPVPSVADPAAFASGDPKPLSRTQGYGWFRVYRELKTDHDGVGGPYFDTLDLNGGHVDAAGQPLPNASVFIITCGSGATFGYRDYAEAHADMPVLFTDADHFAQVRAAETVLHFRVEWSPFLPNTTALPYEMIDPGEIISVNGHQHYYFSPYGSHFGTIRWVQRLDREPPTW